MGEVLKANIKQRSNMAYILFTLNHTSVSDLVSFEIASRFNKLRFQKKPSETWMNQDETIAILHQFDIWFIDY